jgi:hypothetical protein
VAEKQSQSNQPDSEIGIVALNQPPPDWRSWAWCVNHTPFWWGEPLDDVVEEGLLPKEQGSQIAVHLEKYVTDFFEALMDDRREMDEIEGIYDYVDQYLQDHLSSEAWRTIQERDSEMGEMVY